MKKPTKTTLRNKLDKVFSKVIRARDKKCLKCGKQSSLQCAHIASRTHLAGRWNEMNAITLCTGCHLFWAHKEPLEFVAWLQKHHPAVYKEAKEVKNIEWKPTLEDYQALLEELTARLKTLEAK